MSISSPAMAGACGDRFAAPTDRVSAGTVAGAGRSRFASRVLLLVLVLGADGLPVSVLGAAGVPVSVAVWVIVCGPCVITVGPPPGSRLRWVGAAARVPPANRPLPAPPRCDTTVCGAARAEVRQARGSRDTPGPPGSARRNRREPARGRSRGRLDTVASGSHCPFAGDLNRLDWRVARVAHALTGTSADRALKRKSFVQAGIRPDALPALWSNGVGRFWRCCHRMAARG